MANQSGSNSVGPSGQPRSSRSAVAYVRMSTEHQQYSPDNQMAVIGGYAASHDLILVRTYTDDAKSGLQLKNRHGLQQLLHDVKQSDVDFDAILVYDVSRWGRFQDPDESASYEFTCRNAGIEVHYCAEQFVNDGTPISTIVKGVKRAMAAEYSRELSAKVFAGQCRLIEHGYRQGGMAGYGLRRTRIDHSGTPRGVLARGEYKSLQTDRVILVPGPAEEVEIVRWMYRQFVDEGKVEREIATALNHRGVKTDLDRPWTRATVHEVLTNEKYIGNNVYNRRSFKLKEKRETNPPEKWVRANAAFEPIVEPQAFFAAQGIIRERNRRFTDEEMLERLKKLFEHQGHLSGLIIDEAQHMPSSSAYAGRFGSLLRAYRLVGFTPARDYRYIEINRALRAMHPKVVADTIATIEDLGGSVRRDPSTDLLTVNEELSASVVIARCQHTGAGARRWNIRLDTGLAPDLTVALRMDGANEAVLDYYLLPLPALGADRIRLADDNGLMLDAFRCETLEFFFRMAERTRISKLAA